MAMLGVAACGDDSSSDSSSGSASTSSSAASGPAIKVGLVTDIGGLNDRSFNALANKGLEESKSQLGIQGRVITSRSNSDYVPNLSTLAQQKYDLVIGVGFLMAESVETVAKQYPNTKFAIIDSPQADMKSKPTNVEGLLFKENEAGYLAGYLAAKVADKQGADTISSVGGQKIPPVDGYIAGYQAGAKAAVPGIKTLNDYSQDFVDQAKCKELGLKQIQQGSAIVFQVAGQCGLGALDAAKQESKLGVGVDADQAYLGSYILTSAQKKIDNAVVQTVKSVQDNAFKGGSDATFDTKSGGVGLGAIQGPGTEFEADVKKVQGQIAAGSIDIPTEVSGN